LVKTTIIEGEEDVDLEIVEASKKARELFMTRPDQRASVGFHMDDICKQLELFVDSENLERFKLDQRRIRRAYSKGAHAVAEVPLELNQYHSIFPHKRFLPLAIGYGEGFEVDDQASLAVIMYLDLGFLPERSEWD
jgi:hypothetical protein